MRLIRQTIQRIKIKRQINKNLKQNGFNRKQFETSMREWRNRDLNIEQILSMEYSPSVMVDLYEYCMRKCNWDVSALQDGAVKDYLLCDLFQAEVEYGGIQQFLSDCTGDMAAETIDALKMIDEVYADVLTKSVQFFPGGKIPKDSKKRNEIVDNFDEETNVYLNDLRKIVFEHSYVFSKKLYDYLQEHKRDFSAF